MSLTKNDYYFFWMPNQPGGWASQWYPSPFRARIDITSPSGTRIAHDEEALFPTAEHWMMACKALLFGDDAVFAAVLAADGGDMARVKALGREVRGFDGARWATVRAEVVYWGNYHKFGQSAELRACLEETGDRVLVEASPHDRIWGIGFGEGAAMEATERWGLNLLGEALVRVRETLRAEAA
ncbi:hypothetical protein PHLGIDRAFT_122328 [Phlebiopsis gigantea 11061_1 CR5-6]|uniref:NADAR domain-containing protein n=1 Tax=Phlebiopsis gigantea (strain 11061_1 CR5-6) TaxID=745531 RepID=A0A0C3NDI4_PHLG1|nr:hypothetical protein PHLGIDRAFT_122328 [Phlebiopsis gigantea 11061_1 CR5-6]